jgi:hypothetical protein
MSGAPALALERVSGIAERLFEEVRAATFDGVGITRASYGAGEERAMAIVERFAREAELVAERDAGQNLILRLPTEVPSKPILIGSHLDSVPQGGNFEHGLARSRRQAHEGGSGSKAPRYRYYHALGVCRARNAGRTDRAR